MLQCSNMKADGRLIYLHSVWCWWRQCMWYNRSVGKSSLCCLLIFSQPQRRVSTAATLCFSCSVSFNNDDFFLSSVAGELPVAPILVLTLNQPISIDPTQRLMCIDPLMCSWDFKACLHLLSKQKHIPRWEHCVWVQTLKYRIMFRLWLKVSASPVTWDLN